MRTTGRMLKEMVAELATRTGRDLRLDTAYGNYRLIEYLQPEGGRWISSRLPAGQMRGFLEGFTAALDF